MHTGTFRHVTHRLLVCQAHIIPIWPYGTPVKIQVTQDFTISLSQTYTAFSPASVKLTWGWGSALTSLDPQNCTTEVSHLPQLPKQISLGILFVWSRFYRSLTFWR